MLAHVFIRVLYLKRAETFSGDVGGRGELLASGQALQLDRVRGANVSVCQRSWDELTAAILNGFMVDTREGAES